MARGCTNYYYKDSSAHYHRLPLNDKGRLKQWLQMMKLKNPPVNDSVRVCSRHFADKDYEYKGCSKDGVFTRVKTAKLHNKAVPSKFDFASYIIWTPRMPQLKFCLALLPPSKRKRDRSASKTKKEARKVSHHEDYFTVFKHVSTM